MAGQTYSRCKWALRCNESPSPTPQNAKGRVTMPHTRQANLHARQAKKFIKLSQKRISEKYKWAFDIINVSLISGGMAVELVK